MKIELTPDNAAAFGRGVTWIEKRVMERTHGAYWFEAEILEDLETGCFWIEATTTAQ
jgi:hypothetical protein